MTTRGANSFGRHDPLVRPAIEGFAGRVVKRTGDGVLATFDGPGRAMRGGQAELGRGPPALDLHIRAGLHAGEVEVTADDVAGLAVHVAARVAARRPGRDPREEHSPGARRRVGHRVR